MATWTLNMEFYIFCFTLKCKYLQTLTEALWNRSSPFFIFFTVYGGCATQNVVCVTRKRHRATVYEAFADLLFSICWCSRISTLNNYVDSKEGKARNSINLENYNDLCYVFGLFLFYGSTLITAHD